MAELGWEGCRPQSPHCPASPFDTQILFNHETSSFQMFSSEAYGQKNLLFKDSTLELVPIATQNYEAWLGQEYLQAMKGLLCDPNRESLSLPLLATSLPKRDVAGFAMRPPGPATYPGSRLWPEVPVEICHSYLTAA